MTLLRCVIPRDLLQDISSEITDGHDFDALRDFWPEIAANCHPPERYQEELVGTSGRRGEWHPDFVAKSHNVERKLEMARRGSDGFR
jgi:hypothetical protein